MRIGLIGDAHWYAHFIHTFMKNECPDFCLQVGDYMCYEEEWEVPLFWISGNWDKEEVVVELETGRKLKAKNNTYLKSGKLYRLNGLMIATLASFQDESRRHMGPAGVRSEDVTALLSLAGQPIDLVLSHACGLPFIIKTPAGKTKNVEEVGVTSVIRALNPTYAVSGHVHQGAHETIEGVECYRMDDKDAILLEV